MKIEAKQHSIIIGKNSIRSLKSETKKLCPKCKKIYLVTDKNIPRGFIGKIKSNLKGYKIYVSKITPSEKIKNIKTVEHFLNKLLSLNFNRSDLVIGVGGGIIGDISGFISSVFKRGINFINIPTTLLAQVDSCIGGKTGVNSKFGKNLIGSFYQPRLVILDVQILKSLPRRELICGYAEILKHALIKDKKFFNFLKTNTNKILKLENKKLIESIRKSVLIKLKFTERDFKEKKLRMKLNFGHTFAHALEAKNKYSNKLNHGEAVLLGMLIATKISVLCKVCSKEIYEELIKIYKKLSINYLFNYLSLKEISSSIKFMKNDKKNNDEKINLILLRKVGSASNPGAFKFSEDKLKSLIRRMF